MALNMEQVKADLFEAGKAYAEIFGRRMALSYKADVQYFLMQGMELDVIIEIFEETVRAKRPSWAYARAIFKRLMEQDVLTADAYIARQTAWHMTHPTTRVTTWPDADEIRYKQQLRMISMEKERLEAEKKGGNKVG